MDLKRVRSPREEGELEDGEICDDETESLPILRGDGNRRGRGAPPRKRKPHQNSLNMPQMGRHPPAFRHILPYNRPHGHSLFPSGHRQQCGPSGPDRPPVPSPTPLLPLPPTAPLSLPGLGLHGEPGPRTSSFWERSHGALGRFRHRGTPNGGQGNWNRGLRSGGVNRGPCGRFGPGESQGNRKRILPD